MRKIIPDRFGKKWFIILPVYILVLYVIFCGSTVLILHQQLQMRNYVGLLGLASVMALISCVTGFLGGKWIFGITAAGSIIGTAMMLYTFTVKTGWEALAGAATLVTVYLISVGAGIIVELLAFIIKKLMRTQTKQNP